MHSTIWRAAFAAVFLSAAVTFAESPSDTKRDPDSTIRERTESAEPGRMNDRRSGVPGAPNMDPGSGTQGSGTTGGGEAGGGLTGSEGQHDRETGGTR